jgi:sirohydrochlorin cobaltochelatase
MSALSRSDTATAPDALLLVAHGSRDPHWARPLEATADALRTLRPQLDVRLAFLEYTAPSPAHVLAELVAAGSRSVCVAPVFLGIGAHARADMAAIAQAARTAHPQLDLVLLPAAGELPAVQQALARALLQSVDAPPPSDGDRV